MGFLLGAGQEDLVLTLLSTAVGWSRLTNVSSLRFCGLEDMAPLSPWPLPEVTPKPAHLKSTVSTRPAFKETSLPAGIYS